MNASLSAIELGSSTYVLANVVLGFQNPLQPEHELIDKIFD